MRARIELALVNSHDHAAPPVPSGRAIAVTLAVFCALSALAYAVTLNAWALTLACLAAALLSWKLMRMSLSNPRAPKR